MPGTSIAIINMSSLSTTTPFPFTFQPFSVPMASLRMIGLAVAAAAVVVTVIVLEQRKRRTTVPK
jgi:hypothetical protein